MTEGKELPLLSRFEANLLRILQYLLRHGLEKQALELLFDSCERPPCLSREAVALVQNTLAKGCIAILARGGWRHERYLRNGKVVAGRLWQRHPVQELALAFSPYSLQLLIFLTAENLSSKKLQWPVVPATLTVGDHLLVYLVYGALRSTEIGPGLPRKALFLQHALIRLTYAEDFTGAETNAAPNFGIWTTGPGTVILEALQPELAERWRQAEWAKSNSTDWQHMQALGQSQQRTLQTFFEAVEQADRRDLARFLFPVLTDLLPEQPRLEWWTRNLRSFGPRLVDRGETGRAALALPRLLGRLYRWQREAQLVSYFDENYAASQLWKSDWDHWQGEALHARAQILLEQIEQL